MSAEMTSRERMRLVYAHEEPDRLPMHDSPWGPTVERWHREGLPAGVSPAAFFGWENQAGIAHDNSPRYPVQTLEQTEEYTIHTTAWGVTMKDWRSHGGVPEFLDFTIKDRDSWAEAKARMTPSEDRVNWAALEQAWARWEANGAWITAGAWFGYDVFASWIAGYERVLMALALDPDWVRDMIEAALELNIAMLSMIWDRGYKFQCVRWPDDLGYRNGLLFSKDTYRQVVKPAQKRMVDWCHDRGVKTMLHSCGNVMELVPEFVEIGIDALNPLEQKAGMDVYALKRQFGDRLVLEGGIDVRNMTDGARIEEEIGAKLEVLKPGGGYIFHSDHSVPENVSFADYCRVMELARYYGRYR
jgi:uroporphyrinogen decarboxylase